MSDYDLHHSFVTVVAKHSHAAHRLQKHLDQKYRVSIRRFSKAQTDSELEILWEEAIEKGDIAAAYWVLVTHPWASEILVDRIYGEVHMLSHLVGATVRVDMQELNRLQRLSKISTKQLADAESQTKTQIAAKDSTIRQLNDRLMQTEGAARQLDRVREQLTALENDPLSCQLRKQVEKSAAKLMAEQARAGRIEANAEAWQQMAVNRGDRCLHLEGQLAELHAERDALESTLTALLTPDCGNCSTQEDCLNNVDLFGRCILYVGGRSRQCAHFRALVERQNGQFIHHDGGLHDSRSRLGSILPQADAVLCPLDCVSHDAANRVKQFCKRHGKRLVFLPRSSLAAFARGLNELVA
ncbi:DUF2325 domain-containing protein [Beggiatoa alba]|nr:DUF2325 domain-containing protein [Beggiatoa alba]